MRSGFCFLNDGETYSPAEGSTFVFCEDFPDNDGKPELPDDAFRLDLEVLPALFIAGCKTLGIDFMPDASHLFKELNKCVASNEVEAALIDALRRMIR